MVIKPNNIKIGYYLNGNVINNLYYVVYYAVDTTFFSFSLNS